MPDRSFPFFAEKGDCFLFMRTGKNCFLFPKNHAGNDERIRIKAVYISRIRHKTTKCNIFLYNMLILLRKSAVFSIIHIGLL